MHRMQFRLFSTSSQRILANLATVVDRGLTTPVRPVQQQEEAAATVSDSCNPGTFLLLYLSQCLNPIFKMGR